MFFFALYSTVSKQHSYRFIFFFSFELFFFFLGGGGGGIISILDFSKKLKTKVKIKLFQEVNFLNKGWKNVIEQTLALYLQIERDLFLQKIEFFWKNNNKKLGRKSKNCQE